MPKQYKIAIIGQGYVGLPLALEFADFFQVYGFDINADRINELNRGEDHTREVDLVQLENKLKQGRDKNQTSGYLATHKIEAIRDANIFIVTVPTPIDEFNSPDLGPLKSASAMLGKILKPGDIVIYESTVFPGCTEEVCVPLLEQYSGLAYNVGFFVGYSPERINPGDKINTLTQIVKVTSGSTPAIAEEIDCLYRTIIKAGTHKAPSIKVAEASKAIENAQRDVNISFMNELALIFDRMDIDTQDVLAAASTKFNFLKFKPGLVGGHCISVDPYYLTHKATQLGYHPEVILSGRRVNDRIASFIASKTVKLMIEKDLHIKNAAVLIMGFTFKENCPDIRNTKVAVIYNELIQFGLKVDVYDPWANAEEVQTEYGITLLPAIHSNQKYKAVIVALAHDIFLNMNIKDFIEPNAVVFDVKAILDRNMVDSRL